MDNQELIDGIRELLNTKMNCDIPPDADEDTILRDLYAALHGHPGWTPGQGGADLDDDEDDEDDDDENQDEDFDAVTDGDDDEGAAVAQPQGGGGQMSHRRKKRRTQRMSASRGRTVAAEVLRSMRRPPEGRSAMGSIMAEQKRAAARLGHNVPQSTKEERLRQQILSEVLSNNSGDLIR